MTRTRTRFVLGAALFTSGWQGLAVAEPAPESPSAAGSGAEAEASRDSAPAPLFEGPVDVGGYGGMDVAYTRMFGESGALVGVQGALLIGHRFSLGVAGYGFTNQQDGPDDSAGNARVLDTGYGGVTLRYSLFWEDVPVYVTMGALVGGGAIDLRREDERGDRDGSDDEFFVVQPELTLNANVTDWMRVGVTGGYRVTAGVGGLGFDESDLNGVVLGGQMQFGSF